MANLERITLLKEFASEEPSNPFNWYALAIEYRNNDAEQALPLFDKLLKEFPQYLPTYYTAAVFYAELDMIAAAQVVFEKGIELARQQNEAKALQELQNAYQNFQFENDLD